MDARSANNGGIGRPFSGEKIDTEKMRLAKFRKTGEREEGG